MLKLKFIVNSEILLTMLKSGKYVKTSFSPDDPRMECAWQEATYKVSSVFKGYAFDLE